MEGNIAIKTSDLHGKLLVHYFFTPTAGDGSLQADFKASHAQYTLLAPKRILLASGTIHRGCGVYYDLRPSTQDTLQKQREYACLFEVPAAWRADYAIVRCRARGLKRSFVVATEVDCGIGVLSVGMYRQNDAQARDLAEHLARKQQLYLDQLARETRAKSEKKNTMAWLMAVAEAAEQAAANRNAMKAEQPKISIGAALQGEVLEDVGLQTQLSVESKTAGDVLAEAKAALRRLNGKAFPSGGN